MPTLLINNSESQIEGLTDAQFKTLKTILSYKTETSSYFATSGYAAQVRYLIDKTGRFPSGLLYLVEAFLAQIEYKRVDKRVQPDSRKGLFKLNLDLPAGKVIPYPEQLAIARLCATKHRGTISACTGFGKSYTMALLVEKLQVKTLIVVPNLTLKTQLQETFMTLFGSLDNITIENIDSTKLKSFKDFDCLIIDEAHRSAAKTYRTLNKKVWNNAYYKFCFTATPYRSNNEELLLMQSVTGEIIYVVDHKTAVENKYIVPIEAYYIEMPPPEHPTEYGNYAAAYKNEIVNNQVRNDQLHEFLLRLHTNNLSTLCLVKEIDHGNNLTSPELPFFANGQDDRCEGMIRLFTEGKLKTLIATYGVAGEGCDTKPGEYVVIGTPVKSKNLFIQMCGRTFRNYPGKTSCKVILIKDTGHKWFKQAFKAQCKILKDEFGIIPTKLEL